MCDLAQKPVPCTDCCLVCTYCPKTMRLKSCSALQGYDARLPVADRGALSKTATKTAGGGARDKRNDTSDSGKSRTVSSDSD